MTFEYSNNLSLLYMNDVFKQLLFKLSQLLRKANQGQTSLSYVASSTWNKLTN